MKSAMKDESRRFIELARCALLGNITILHDDDAVGNSQRLVLIVRDIDGGEAEPLLQFADFRTDACGAGAHRDWISGSSSSSTCGSSTSARATATRCCWPPESSAGQPLAIPGKADQRQPFLSPLARFLLFHPEDSRP